MRNIVVIGGGIAGTEAAITVARTVPRAKVTLISQWSTLRVLPQLVYVPFGAPPRPVEVRLNRALAWDGIDLIIDTCVHIDMKGHVAELASGKKLHYDAIIVASGIAQPPSAARRLRTLGDALAIRDDLEKLANSSERNRTIVLEVPEGCTWSPPAFEFALLLAKWRQDKGLDDVRILMEIEASEPLDMFNFMASQVVRDALDTKNVEILAQVPPSHMDRLPGTVTIVFDGFIAQRVHGLPPLTADGFYDVDQNGSVATDVYIIGDAADHPYKSGFSVGWQARRIAQGLGGDLSLLGDFVDGIPVLQCEYQMDLGDETLCVRLQRQIEHDDLHSLFIPNVQDVRIVPGKPDKLAGTLLRPHVTEISNVHPLPRVPQVNEALGQSPQTALESLPASQQIH